MPSKISAEGQHLIDSLEAHLKAVKAAVHGGSDAMTEHAKEAWEDVQDAMADVEAKFRAAGADQPKTLATADVNAPQSAPAPAGGLGSTAASGSLPSTFGDAGAAASDTPHA